MLSGKYNFPGITKITYFLNTQFANKLLNKYIVHVFWLKYQNRLENLEAIGEKIWIFSCWAEIVKYNKTNLLS